MQEARDATAEILSSSPSKRAAPSSDAGKSPKSPKVASEAPKAVRSPKPFSL